MKISKYVTKYDYIAYYVKQPSMWFYTNTEIDALYRTEYEIFSKNKNIEVDFDDENAEEDLDELEAEDSYSIYRELLSESEDVDKNNYLIIEGLIIDQMSKKHIIDYYSDQYAKLLNFQFYVYDFDEHKTTIESNIKKTIELIEKNENIIIFQPAFIHNKLNIVTKCDALVKINKDIFIIETKATSTAKFHHLLDLFYQKQILENVLDKYNLMYRLCLIKYEYQNKKHVSFIISDTINLKKSVSCSKIDDLDVKQSIKLGSQYAWKQKNHPDYFIDDILDFNTTELFNILKDDKISILNNLYNSFDKVIQELWAHKKVVEKQNIPQPLLPHPNDKNVFKNTDLWQQLRKLYYLKGFDIFGYSGNVIDFSSSNIEKIAKIGPNYKYDYIPFIRYINSANGKSAAKNIDRLFNNRDQFRVDKDNYKNLVSKLKEKKVYFDFESINPCIRAIDNSLPFTQVVTQNSVIIDNGEGIENSICNNMMIDPNHIDINWFKSIIDAIYQSDEYSYVVYNRNFEANRLKEMAKFINEKEYFQKVQTINNNMFDLADFFMFKKDGDVIVVKELNGFFSIKCVLPLVQKYAPEIFTSTGCKNYKTLEIGNGLVCQQKTLSRFYGSITDTEWETIVNNSKIYCENDVRAMVAVEYFIKNYITKKCNYV